MEITSKNVRQWSRLGPRALYGMVLTELAEANDKIFALSADLGNSSGLQRLMNNNSEKFLNVGIAEQNLIGVAAGFAKEGMIPFASSFAPFITLRCADQIRMNMGYMHLNIKAVGLGSGISMAGLGNSHYGVDDIAFMRSIPGIVILSPADCGELLKAVEAAAKYNGPVYIRLTGESGMPIVYESDFEYNIGQAIVLREGCDVAFVATGSMVYTVLKVAELLEDYGVSSSVIDMHTLKPIDECAVSTFAQNCKLVVTAEEHSIIGGLGSSIAQILCKQAIHAKLISFGLPDEYLQAGSYSYMLDRYGLTVDNIVNTVRDSLAT